jgi:chorismate lyase
MRTVGSVALNAAPDVDLLKQPWLQRQVLMRSGHPESTALVYAASWWNEADAAHLLKDASVPVGAVLRQSRAEIFRDIRSVYLGDCPKLALMFGAPGPFWGRDYVFWRHGRPLTVIHEVFSPQLSRYLGPASNCARGASGGVGLQSSLQLPINGNGSVDGNGISTR